MQINYNASNWYWIVAGSTTQVYSSASSSYVDLSNTTYQAWIAAGNVASPISHNDMLLIQIDILESKQNLRRMREAAAGTDGGWMANLNSSIAFLRSQLT